MNGKDQRGESTRQGTWKQWLIGLCPAVALIAAALVFRSSNPPAVARAQAPVKSTPKGAASGAPRAAAPSVGPTSRFGARPAAATTPDNRSAPTGGVSSGNEPVIRGAGAKAPPSVKSLSVVAVVNAEQISKNDLGKECLRRYGGEVLDNLLNKVLLSDACAAKGINITEQDVGEEMDRIAAKFGLPRDRWLALLREERGFTEEQYRREVVWPMLALRRASALDVEVTKDEIKQAFESEYGPKVRCRLIIMDAAKKKPTPQQVLATLKSDPKQFGKLAQQHCEDPSVAAASGVIPPIALHAGEEAIEEAAFDLQKGQISGLIPVAQGKKLVILKCEDHLPQQFISGKDLPGVEKSLEGRIRDNKTRTAAAQFFAKVHKEAKIINAIADPSKRKEVPAGAAAIVNGRQITIQQLTDECLVRFGGDVLDGEINRKLFTQELSRRKLAVSEQDIQAEIARAADANGYIKNGQPDIEKWINDVTTQDGATVELYRSDVVWPTCALKKLCENRVKVTENDLQKGFESNYGERVRVLAIVLSDQRQANRVWDMARNDPTDTKFSQLAQQYSVEPSSRANGGEVPPVCKHSGSPVIEKAAFELKAGELSGIIAVEDQFIILRCLGRTEPVQKDMAAVRDALYKDIYEKKLRTEMNREFERLQDAAQIDNFLAGTSQAPKGKNSGPSATSVRPALNAGGGIAPASATLPRTKMPLKR